MTTYQQELILNNLELARKIASKHKKKLSFISHDELKSAAYFGLVQAAIRFLPEKNIKFSTFAYNRILGAIKDYLRELSWGTRSQKWKKQEKELEIFPVICDDFDDLISCLSPRNKKIMELYYVESLSLDTISKICTLHTSRISQILKESRSIIKKQLCEM
jgi:RNA polymerase sigma factor (sigma-70 family)